MANEEPEDRLLVAAAIAGDIASFERLYRKYAGRVYGLCVRLARNAADAQDCTQETFIRAWQRLSSFEGRSSLGTWLHRIAVNEVLARKRRSSSEARHLKIVHSDRGAEPARMDRADELEEIEQAIARLPERAREAFVLHKIYGYTHEEAADLLNVAVGTCKAQVHRAVKLLGKALRDQDVKQTAVNSDD